MNVRELIFLVKYQLDKGSLSQINQSVTQVKQAVSNVTSNLGNSTAKATQGLRQAVAPAQALTTNLNNTATASNRLGNQIKWSGGQIVSSIQNANGPLSFMSQNLNSTANLASRLSAITGTIGTQFSQGLRVANQATANLNTSLANVGSSGNRSVRSIGQGFQQASRQITNFGNTAQQTTSRVANGVNAVGSSLRSLIPVTAMVQGVFMSVGQAIMSTMANAVQSVEDAATKMQSLDGRLRSETTSDEHRKRLEQQLFEVSQRSRANFEDSGDLFYKVSRAKEQTGMNEQQNLDITETVGKALTVGGASTQEKSATILQLSQALGSGVLQGDELRSLNENASGLMNEIAKYFNTTVGGLREMGRNGELTSQKVAEAILHSKKAIDEQYSKMPLTLSDARTEIANILKKMVLDFEHATGFFDGLSKSIIKPFQMLQSGIANLSKRLGGTQGTMRMMIVLFTSLGVAMAAVNFSRVIGSLQNLTMAFRTFMSVNGLAMGKFLLIAAVVALIALAFEDLYTWINGGESVIGDFLGPFDQFKEKNAWVQELIDSFQVLWALLVDLKNQFVNAFVGVDLGPLQQAFATLGQALLPLVVVALQAILNVIIGVILGTNWLISKFLELLESGNMVARLLQMAFEFFINQLVAGFNLISAIFTGNWSGALEAVKGMFSSFRDFAISCLKAIGDGIANWVVNKLADAKQSVLEFLGWSDKQTQNAMQDAQNTNITINQEISGGATVNQTVENNGGEIYAD